MLLLLSATLLLALSVRDSALADGIDDLNVAINDFAFKLHKTLPSKENILFSPISASIALAMLYQGAGGGTKEEVRKVLSYDVAGLDDQSLNRDLKGLVSDLERFSGENELGIANAIISHSSYSILEPYKKILKEFYEAELKEIDNEGTIPIEEINIWASNKTKGKITKLVESLSPDTVLVVLNAIYFKGLWAKGFDKNQTRNGTFYNEGSNVATVSMMSATHEVFYGEETTFRALKLLYKGGNISTVILLPKEKDGLSKLEKELNSTVLNGVIRKMENTFVRITIPKFKLRYSMELNEYLQALGMVSAFNDGADFSGVSDVSLKVSRIIHKAAVEVNEEGSEVAANSGALMIPISLPPSFRVEHPFLFFMIEERKGTILFCGRVTDL